VRRQDVRKVLILFLFFLAPRNYDFANAIVHQSHVGNTDLKLEPKNIQPSPIKSNNHWKMLQDYQTFPRKDRPTPGRSFEDAAYQFAKRDPVTA
jgi:hypothetical protein